MTVYVVSIVLDVVLCVFCHIVLLLFVCVIGGGGGGGESSTGWLSKVCGWVCMHCV